MSFEDTQLHAALIRVLDGVPYDVLRRRVMALSERYRAEGIDDCTRGMRDELDCLAYAVVRMPATARAIHAALVAVDRHVVGAFATHLDLGGGTGAAAWAAAAVWPGIVTEIVEREPAAVRLGRRIGQANSIWTTADLRRWRPERRVSLITIAYVLNELAEVDRWELVEMAAGAADTVVIVEPGTPGGHRRTLAARDQLITGGLTIAAPCPHQLGCPADWCHFGVRLPRTELHRVLKDGVRNFEDEKFTYVVATRAPVRAAEARVIGRPDYPKARVVLDLCTSSGARERAVVPKSASMYRAARSTSWGDAWGQRS